MGYTFHIGEAGIKAAEPEECDKLATLRVYVPVVVRFPDAPGIANWHDFSYGGFAHVAEAGLADILLQDPATGYRALLVPDHPGAAHLFPSHLARFEAGLATVKAKHREGDEAPEVQGMEWLVWWTRWALDNCKIPTLANR